MGSVSGVLGEYPNCERDGEDNLSMSVNNSSVKMKIILVNISCKPSHCETPLGFNLLYL